MNVNLNRLKRGFIRPYNARPIFEGPSLVFLGPFQPSGLVFLRQEGFPPCLKTKIALMA